MSETTEGPWTVEAARRLYFVDRWSLGYFDVDESGEVVAKPMRDRGIAVRLKEVISAASRRNLSAPLLIRFQDILRDRVETINLAFRRAIDEFHYPGRYRGVFPIKVNQLREVVEEILDAGEPFDFGLEVGSKPELLAAMALQPAPGSLMICNGYKDEGFIRMALMASKLGKEVILVIEKLEELQQIVRTAREVGVAPRIGMRIRLQSKSAGKWAESGGEDAKFGLNTMDLLEAAELLRSEGLADGFQLLHFHIGSQVPDIFTVKKSVQECARYYAKLRQLGFEVRYIDVGGGLGVDYDGSRTASDSSTDYTLQEYANDVVYHVGEVCQQEGVPAPDLISESGRALVAYHSVLLVQVFGSIRKTGRRRPVAYGEDEHPLVKELLEIRNNLDRLNKREAFHDALNCKEGALDAFMLGLLDLEARAKVETLYWEIGRGVVASFRGQAHVPEEIRKLEDSLSDQYLCNFSLFQSLIDHWALDQLFPIMPISRLDERPDREATLVDITCDSDGQINQFIDPGGARDTLALHSCGEEKGEEPYYLGFFLMGAYQDVMGDLHNLFGRVNEVHVFLDPDEPEGYYIEETIAGNAIDESLAWVQYDSKELKRRVKAQVSDAIRNDRLKPSEAMELQTAYERALQEYTYLKLT